jgi:hypothetical protein
MEFLNESLELIPCIPLDPNDFRKNKKRSLHKIPKRERLTFWEQSFKEAGIEGIKPLDLESSLRNVSVRDIVNKQVMHEIISKSWLRISKEASTWQPLIQSIEGGLSLLHAGKVILSAQCCSDFGNLKNWQETAKSRETNWQMLWNGHPWLYSRYENGMIFLTDYTETEPKSLAEGKYAIPAKIFKEAVVHAEKDLAEFGERFYALWLAETKQN